MHSLRLKTAAFTVVAILASILAFALASFFTVGQETTASAAEKMQLLSETAQQSLDASLTGVKQTVDMTSHIATGTLDSVLLVECGANQPADQRTDEQTTRLDAFVKEHCEHVEHAFSSMANHTYDVTSYYYCINPELSESQHGFYYSIMGKAGFEHRTPIDARNLDPNDPEDAAWYFHTIEHGMATWAGPYRAHSLNDEYVVSYVVPIYRSGILIGLLGMDVSLETITHKVDQLEVYDTGYAFLLDDEGRVLYHPTLSMAELPTSARQITDAGYFERSSSDGRIIQYDKNGEKWQLCFSSLVNGSRLVVAAPVSETVAPWQHLLGTIPLISVFILAIFVPLTLVGMSAIVRPLQQLTVAAHELAEGGHDIKLDYQGNDEVGELTGAFRQMRDHLEVYLSDINIPSYTDELTGVKNKSAYRIYAARLDDAMDRREERKKFGFALVLFECADLGHMTDEYGTKVTDAYIKTVCQHICWVYSRSPVFRVDRGTFTVILEDRDFLNRDELLADFEITAARHNAQAQEPWQCVQVRKGMATFTQGRDTGVESVAARARAHMEQPDA